jgi:HAD superfamily hydrolase (TIGR01509 family)
MIKGVLLDIDGTLVLSNDAHARAWVEAFVHFDYKVKFEDVRRLIGMGSDKLMPKVIPKLDSESGEGKDISVYRSKIFLEKYSPRLEPTPGSRELVKLLLSSGFKLMIASSAKENELQALLKAAKVDDLLKEATTSADADNSKPDPDIIQAALDKINIPATQVLMVGDTPYDIEAATKAGVKTVAVRCGGWQDADLKNAIAIYNDPMGIVSNYELSPFLHRSF